MSHDVICGDCRQILPTLETESVDVCVTDPPYGDTSLNWDVPLTAWLPLIRRVLKPHGSLWCFGSLRMFMAQAEAFRVNGWRLAQDIVWEKHNGSSFHADRFKRVHEHVVQFYPAAVPWESVWKSPQVTMDATARAFRRKQRPPHTGHIDAGSYLSVDGGPRLERSVLHVRSCHGYAQHPTQKPVGILTPLIEYSCPPDGTVLDPFAGSGSTARAAKDVGRNAIVIEQDAAYCEIARERLRQEVLPLEGITA